MKYVKSFEDYKKHTSLHIKRVKLIGMKLYNDNKETFPEINERLLKEFLSIHDKGKLAKYLKKMYPYYGKNKTQDFRPIINELNCYDDDYARIFCKINQLSEKQTSQLIRIEKIADCIDRNLNKVSPEEFGVEKMAPITDFISQEDLILAQPIIDDYESIIDGLDFL